MFFLNNCTTKHKVSKVYLRFELVYWWDHKAFKWPVGWRQFPAICHNWRLRNWQLFLRTSADFFGRGNTRRGGFGFWKTWTTAVCLTAAWFCHLFLGWQGISALPLARFIRTSSFSLVLTFRIPPLWLAVRFWIFSLTLANCAGFLYSNANRWLLADSLRSFNCIFLNWAWSLQKK